MLCDLKCVYQYAACVIGKLLSQWDGVPVAGVLPTTVKSSTEEQEAAAFLGQEIPKITEALMFTQTET